MNNDQIPKNRATSPRRHKKSQREIFKETYLPVIIGCAALLLILIFIVGSITRAIQNHQIKVQLAREESIAAVQQQKALDDESESIIKTAAQYAASYDYDSAIRAIENFSGSMADYPQMENDYKKYLDARTSLVLWDDPASILSLSFQMLMADPTRCYNDANYGSSYNRNFITVDEFQNILNQLYENDYILIRLDNVTKGSTPLELFLPKGKKPLIITQTNINYYRYMIDSDGDWLPDKDGAGFASRLIINENDAITCEMVDAQGNVTTGYFDLIPILESFIATHPDFSYKGARAILAVTGYDGILGYRTNASAAEKIGESQRQNEIAEATRVVTRLRELGYDFACYTYENEPYGSYSAQQIQEEMTKWESEVTPILGKTDIFVFSRNSDIENPGMPYVNDRFDVLKSYGYTRYLGFCEDDQSWFYAGSDYIRMGRILVSGFNLMHNELWFDGIFDAATILDVNRAEIPS